MAAIPSPLERLIDPLFEAKSLEVWIKRDDLIHPFIMGNKWRKLKYNLHFARENGYEGILTVGGAYSNHIAATSATCRENGLKSIGIIRGEELLPSSNNTLRRAVENGMQLQFVSRESFREMRENREGISDRDPGYFYIPEGGTNELAIRGCEEIIGELELPYHYLVTPLGTGGTMAGLLKGLKGRSKVLGFSALKGDFVTGDFQKLRQKYNISYTNYRIITDFHFGGFGKVTDLLINFINQTRKTVNLLLDPVYTGKMYFGLLRLIEMDFFERGSILVILHTGGLQGIEGYNEKHSKKILL